MTHAGCPGHPHSSADPQVPPAPSDSPQLLLVQSAVGGVTGGGVTGGGVTGGGVTGGGVTGGVTQDAA